MKRRPVGAVVGALALAAALAAGCTSGSGGGNQGPITAGTSPSTAPMSTAVAPTTSSASISPSATPTTPPLSKFENDPGVQTLRAWAAAVAHALTSGHASSALANSLMTPSIRARVMRVDKDEVGRIYPGPQPFQPIAVTTATASTRVVRICFLANGFSQNPKTHKVNPRSVERLTATILRINGRWRISNFSNGAFSCDGVTIATPSW